MKNTTDSRGRNTTIFKLRLADWLMIGCLFDRSIDQTIDHNNGTNLNDAYGFTACMAINVCMFVRLIGNWS